MVLDEVRWSTRADLSDPREGDGNLLSARFAHWDVWNPVHTAREGRFFEMPVRGATDEAFDTAGDHVRLLFDHGNDPSIGNRTLGSFAGYKNTEAGPEAQFELFEDTSQVKDLMPGIRSGTYGLSYRFGIADPKDQEWNYNPARSEHNPEGLPERRILKCRVAEVSVTPFPMDQATNGGGALSVRSLERRYGVEDRPGDGSGFPAGVPGTETVRADEGKSLAALVLRRAQVAARFK